MQQRICQIHPTLRSVVARSTLRAFVTIVLIFILTYILVDLSKFCAFILWHHPASLLFSSQIYTKKMIIINLMFLYVSVSILKTHNICVHLYMRTFKDIGNSALLLEKYCRNLISIWWQKDHQHIFSPNKILQHQFSLICFCWTHSCLQKGYSPVHKIFTHENH